MISFQMEYKTPLRGLGFLSDRGHIILTAEKDSIEQRTERALHFPVYKTDPVHRQMFQVTSKIISRKIKSFF